MKPIITAPNNVLTQEAKPVVAFDSELKRLIKDMKAALNATRNPKGVGLAAPQIGVPYRVFITKPKEDVVIRVFINPIVVKSSTTQTDGVPDRGNKLEGCLSIPTIWGYVKRAESVTLSYQDEHGEKHTEKFTGFLATIIQHETDHINGTLFTHRVLEQQGKFFQTGKDKDGKEVLEEIELK